MAHIRVATSAFAQRLSLASFIAIAASSANAADLAPVAPAPVEGWTITLGVGPGVSTSFPGARSVSIWPTGYISYRRPSEPDSFVSDDGFGIALLDLPWINTKSH
jgi:MipA family protein